jgi:DNA modification methylase
MITNELINIDCREGFKFLPDESIDLVVSDVPYRIVHHGTSACGGDVKPPQ